MGADLFLNPPRETPRTLAEQVADLEQFAREQGRIVQRLRQELEQARSELDTLKKSIRIVKAANGKNK